MNVTTRMWTDKEYRGIANVIKEYSFQNEVYLLYFSFNNKVNFYCKQEDALTCPGFIFFNIYDSMYFQIRR